MQCGCRWIRRRLAFASSSSLEPAVYFGIFQFPGRERVSLFPASCRLPIIRFKRRSRRPRWIRIGKPAHVFSPVRILSGRSAFGGQAGRRTRDCQHRFPCHAGTTLEIWRHRHYRRSPSRATAACSTAWRRCWRAARTAAIRPGKTYHHSTLTKATQYLQSQLHKAAACLAPRSSSRARSITRTPIAPTSISRSVPGPKIRVDIEGAHLWSWTRKALLPVYQGVGVDDESVQEGRQALSSYFQAKGYFDVKVDAHLDQGKSQDTIVYRIAKEKKHKVDEVKISGNTSCRASQLTPHLDGGEETLLLRRVNSAISSCAPASIT